MRATKFRAWCDVCREFVPIFGLIQHCDKGLLYYCPHHEGGSTEVILTEFTGLQDSEGVDIYEGDLLKHKFYSNPVEVTFRDGAFGAEDVSLFSSGLRVIGNIYEYPELVEGK